MNTTWGARVNVNCILASAGEKKFSEKKKNSAEPESRRPSHVVGGRLLISFVEWFKETSNPPFKSIMIQLIKGPFIHVGS